MKLIEAKLFLREIENSNELILEKYDSKTMDYYDFIESQSKEDYKQVIINSDYMFSIIQHYFLERQFRLISIKFNEEDPVLSEEINGYINVLQSDRGFLIKLLDRLNFLENEGSIDLQEVCMQGFKEDSSRESRIIFRSNGLLSITDYSYDIESNYFLTFFNRLINRKSSNG